MGVYEQSEVEEFNSRFFDRLPAHELSPILDIAAQRFTTELELAEADKIDFKIKAKQFVNIVNHVKQNPNYQSQVVNNPDVQNRRIALEKIIKQAITQERKRELDLYKRYTSDLEFQRAFDVTIERMLNQELDSRQDTA